MTLEKKFQALLLLVLSYIAIHDQVHGAWLPPWLAAHLIRSQVSFWSIMVYGDFVYEFLLILLSCSRLSRLIGICM